MSDRKAIIHEFCTALGNDVGQVLKNLAPDYKWWAAGIGDIDGRYHELAGTLKPHVHGAFRITVDDIIIEGDNAAVQMTSSADLKNGTRYANQYFLRLAFKDNKIVSVREYHDTAHAKEILDPILRLGKVDG